LKNFKNRIGITGGTFDPIHYGHLIISEAVREEFKLDKVLFIPTGTPPHKTNKKVTEARHRYEITCRAISSNSRFEASSIEVERQGNTYTIDTLNRLKEVYGDLTEFFFIVGADTIMELTTWKEYVKVFKMCEFIAVERPGFKTTDYKNKIEQLKATYDIVIHSINAPLIEISSTDIRERLKNGKSIKYLVPESVENYIYENGLYSFDS